MQNFFLAIRATCTMDVCDLTARFGRVVPSNSLGEKGLTFLNSYFASSDFLDLSTHFSVTQVLSPDLITFPTAL